MRFQVGDRVVRPINCHKPLAQWKYKHGTVAKAYSKEAEVCLEGDLILGPYSELYDVIWDTEYRKEAAGCPGYYLDEHGFFDYGIDHEGHHTLSSALRYLWNSFKTMLEYDTELDGDPFFFLKVN